MTTSHPWTELHSLLVTKSCTPSFNFYSRSFQIFKFYALAMASLRKTHLAIIIILSGICMLCYLLLFESSFFNVLKTETDGLQSNIIISSLSSSTDIKQPFNASSNNSISESYYLNSHLFRLSSIKRTEIQSSDWTNPSIITSNTVIIGFCCEIPNNFECILQKYVLIFSMALFNASSTNLYFQQCGKNGLAQPSHSIISIKDRRDILLNANNSKTWSSIDSNQWFQPDMYLCQGYFWDKSLIDTRDNHKDFIQLQHEQVIDLMEYDVAVGKNPRFPSHRLSSFRPFLVTPNTEFWGGYPCKRYDVIFDTVIMRNNEGCFGVHAPPAFWYEFMRINNQTSQLMLPTSKNKKDEYVNHVMSIKNRKLFHTLFLVKFCYKSGRYDADAVARVLFYDLLKERYSNGSEIGIDALGNCRMDRAARKKLKFVERGLDYTYGYQGVRDGAVQMALKYKFMIAFENGRTNGYMTEKFFNAMYGYAIPIYFGDDMASTYFNEHRFINCNISDEHGLVLRELTNKNKKGGIMNNEQNLLRQLKEIIGERLNECVDRVMEIDADDEKYKEMLLQPLFKNNQYDKSILDPFTMADRLKSVLKSVDSYLMNEVNKDKSE